MTLMFVFVSCEDKTSYDDSRITYYVTFAMNGDQTMLVPVGTTYTDPGVKATEGDKDVTSSMTTTGTVNANKVGLYPVTYSAINADGFASSVTRTVIVYDPTVNTDISGTYTLAAGSYRLNLQYNTKIAFSGYKVTITYIAPGIFYVSDFLAGYYDKRAGYGSAYTMTGYIKLNPNNTIEMLSSKIAGWGDSLDSLANATFNPATNAIHWEATYVGSYTWFIDLTK